jgi:hypothetical protein
MPLDETHVVDAAHGPAGMVTAGAAFEERCVPGMQEGYEKLSQKACFCEPRTEGVLGTPPHLAVLKRWQEYAERGTRRSQPRW